MNVNRRHFLKTTGTALTATALNPLSCSRETQSPKPNIILILADDLGYGDLGCYGQEHIQTPNIDRLAAGGMRFTQFYAGSPVCAPSRCVLMTGLHTGHCYVRGNKEADPYGQIPLPAQTTTVAKLLKQAGYATGVFGKWGLGVENSTGDPQSLGFDTFFGYYDQVHAHNSFPEYLYKNRQKVFLNNEVEYMPKEHWTRGMGSYATQKVDYSNDLCRDEALRFMEDNAGKSYFLYLPITMPHNNGEAPEGDHFESPTLNPYTGKPWSGENKAYAAMITRLDDYVGQILDKLKETGQEQNTLILFTSDNGGLQNPLFKSNGILRGYKQDLTEGGIRVPLIARWPGRIQPGRVSEHISAFQDFLPTACDLARIPGPTGTDGISFMPELTGTKQNIHHHLYWEFHWWNPGRQAVRLGKWKGIRAAVGEDQDAPIELYDLSTDLSESKNVADQFPEIVMQIRRIMKKAHVKSELFQFQYEKVETSVR